MALLEIRSAKTSLTNKKNRWKESEDGSARKENNCSVKNMTSKTVKMKEKGKKTIGHSIKTSKTLKTEEKGKKTTG